MREQCKALLREEKLMAIVRGIKAEDCMAVSQALYDGGFRFMEIPYNMKNPQSWEESARTIGELARFWEGKMYVGAGTVTSVELVELTEKYGGSFIVSPDCNMEVIGRTVELGLVSIPGALTPTEIMTAHRAGADFVKLFPAGALGPDYIKAVKAPLSHIELLAVGGVDEKNVAAFLEKGASGVALGSNLVNPKWIEAGEFCKIESLARQLVEEIKNKK